MSNLTNIGLVVHCKKALSERWGYVWGTFGQLLTPKLLQMQVDQYPVIKEKLDWIKTHWIGNKVADCVGLIKSYMWWAVDHPVYNPSTDVSANGMFSIAKEKGPIGSIPEIRGICVWKDGHIGVYIGNGQVIESHGTKFGVIQTPLKGEGSTAWTHWLKCPFITYEEVSNVDEWKLKIIRDAFSAGLITDMEQWLRRADEPAPVWMVLKTELKLKELIDKFHSVNKV